MLRLKIEHRTTYSYTQAVSFGRHLLVLRPREGHDLRILNMTLRIEPAHEIAWVRDIYSNSIAVVEFTEMANRLDIMSTVSIERSDPFPIRSFHHPGLVTWPVNYPSEELPLITAYRTPSYPDETAIIMRWLDEVLPRQHDDAEGMLLDLCQRVHGFIAYRRRLEKGVQTPAQTLQIGSGSCRDMATLMMDASRALGMASRFASGYLHGAASLAGAASTHAWTEVYLPALGWRGFDPTVGKAIGLHHVVMGVSQHPRGVMPVSGTFHGTPQAYESMDVKVRTQELPAEVDAEIW